MSDPSVNVTETVVTETYYPAEPDVIEVPVEVPVAEPDAVEDEVEDLRMAEDARFTEMDSKIDKLTEALTGVAESQSRISELLAAKHEKPDTEKDDKPDGNDSPGVPNSPPATPDDDPPEPAEPGMPAPTAGEVVNEAQTPGAGLSAGSADHKPGGDSAPKQKLGWRRYALGGSGGRLT